MSYPTEFVAGNQLSAAELNDYTLNPAYTYGETITALDALYLKSSDSKLYKTDADVLESVRNFAGFAIASGIANDTKRILGPGKVVTGLSGLTAGAKVYLSATAGAVTSTAPTTGYTRPIGFALSTTTLLVLPDDFGGEFGSGADGALAISSGTTSLNNASKNVYQYTSVSITGTGALSMGSNMQGIPLIVFVQGDLTITSSATPAVNGNGRGGTGGAGGSADGDGVAATLTGYRATATAAAGGQQGNTLGTQRGGGGGGGGAGIGNSGTAGNPDATTSTILGGAGGSLEAFSSLQSIARFLAINPMGQGGSGGGGGGSGGGGGGAGGAGGNGGGCIIFVVGGNINITGVLEVKGDAGTAGTNHANNCGGGGGGGGGGFIGIFYFGDVTANSGTYTVTAGAGGAKGTGGDQGGDGGAGGAGQSIVRKIVSMRGI